MHKVLNFFLNVKNLDEEALHTVLCEVESIINSRPVTKASTDPNDLEALTPNHLLLLKSIFMTRRLSRGRHVCAQVMEAGAIQVRLVLE